MPECLIALGSNLGDRRGTLEAAVARLAEVVTVSARSAWRETAPVGGPAGQGAFLNGALRGPTSLTPADLLAELKRIEVALGRREGPRWGPRALDLDLLLYGQSVLQTPALVVPHPRMAWRRFVLEPAAEVAPAMRHPLIGWTVAEMLEHLDTAPDYVAITGPIGSGKSRLAEQVAARTGARLVRESVDPAALARFYADPLQTGWDMEMQFLDQRRGLLDRGAAEWGRRGAWSVSDFWFEQSAAFAEVWLSAGRLAEFHARWRQAAEAVVRPKLIVFLDAPTPRLLERIARRGRPGEDHLDGATLDRIRAAISAHAASPGRGPLLCVAEESAPDALEEVLAAMEAMR